MVLLLILNGRLATILCKQQFLQAKSTDKLQGTDEEWKGKVLVYCSGKLKSYNYKLASFEGFPLPS